MHGFLNFYRDVRKKRQGVVVHTLGAQETKLGRR
jgi:hypothetical protein